MSKSSLSERKLAIMQLKQGKKVDEVANMLNRHPNWVRKWQKRFSEQGWAGLLEQSRRPKTMPQKLSAEVKQAVCQARWELEAEAALGTGLKYIGGRAVKTKLKEKEVTPLPSVASIERILGEAGLTNKRGKSDHSPIRYPHLEVQEPNQLYQVDIVPHFLQGGERIACFNALDVVSRYPIGQAYARRRSQEAATFLIYLWQEMGIPQYTQVDNEGCFSGGTTHSYVLGKVVRLALEVGTELLFSPVYHPQSNGFVERFHQEYDRHVWEETYLPDIEAVNKQADHFFGLYRQRQGHRRLGAQTPASLQAAYPATKLSPTFQLAASKRPLREGRIHFMRRVSLAGKVSVLNVDWIVPDPDPATGVWVTIDFQLAQTTLSIWDKAPDAPERRCLVTYPFPLKEPVQPRLPRQPLADRQEQQVLSPTHSEPLHSRQFEPVSNTRASLGKQLLLLPLILTEQLTHRLFHTMS